MSNDNIKYKNAAMALRADSNYILLRQAMIEQLSEPSLSILDKSDTLVARSHVYDLGIRNFFLWVDKTAAGSSDPDLANTLQPFDHYGEEQK